MVSSLHYKEDNGVARFEEIILPHLGPAYDLARRPRHTEHGLDEVDQEAYFREGKLFESPHGTDASARITLKEKDGVVRFEEMIVPHMDAAYNLARWLTRDAHDAEDMVQEAYLRAFRFFGAFRGGDSRAWLLTIVRNTCYNWLEKNRARDVTTVFDEEIHTTEDDTTDPSALVLKSGDMEMLKESLEQLPVEFREVVVLRELEGLSYKQIAEIANIPTGTVMSRLARARERLKKILCSRLKENP